MSRDPSEVSCVTFCTSHFRRYNLMYIAELNVDLQKRRTDRGDTYEIT